MARALQAVAKGLRRQEGLWKTDADSAVLSDFAAICKIYPAAIRGSAALL